MKINKMRKYTYPCLYRGQQIFKVFWAKNEKEAAKMINQTIYVVKTYCTKTNDGEIFGGVMAYFDSGMLWTEERELKEKLMPLEELKKLVDKYADLRIGEMKLSIAHKLNN